MPKYQKTDYENCFFEVGKHHDEEGNPLVVVDGKCIGPVDAVLEFVGQYGGDDEAIARLQASVRSMRRDFQSCMIAAVKDAQGRRLL